MSTDAASPEELFKQNCLGSADCTAIELLIEPRIADLGGFSVRRVLPVRQRRMVGPWTFFDHMGPVEFAPGKGVNVQPHPHINLATVTYLFEGEILHRDSLGSYQSIHPGDVNLMVAGKGITHSERERPEATQTVRRLNGLQLWLALPEADEECEPAFYHYPSEAIPRVTVGGVAIRVIMGSAFGVSSPVKVFADTLYVEAQLQAGQQISLPQAEERAVYVVEGECRASDTLLAEHSMAVFSKGLDVELTANRGAHIVIIGGAHLGKRYMEWNFVSSRRERIAQAKADWKAQRFAKVVGDEDEFIPLPE